MKKLFAAILTLCIFLSLCACDAERGEENTLTATEIKPAAAPTESAKNDATEPTEEETAAPTETVDSMVLFENYLGSYLDSSHYHTDNQGLIYLNSEYKVNEYGYLPANGYILIDGHLKVTTKKSTLNDLLLQGWNLGFELTDENQIGAHISASGYTLERDGHEITIGLLNNTDEAIHLKDALISYIVLEQYISRDYFENRVASAPDFLIDGKIDADANIQTIIDLYGEPTNISFTMKDRSAYMVIKYDALHFQMSVDGNTLYCVSWY